jgi:tRNA pseudouridine38-40 synthase
MAGNFKLIIEYDGTHYHGWQRQPRHRSIQAEIETALAIMTRQPVVLIGSGRTDAGVHALGQVANFRSDTSIPPEALRDGLNSLLPEDIVIRECTVAGHDFHARYDVKSKVYRYTILNRVLPTALERDYVWWIRTPLNREAMQQAAASVLGEHDFKAFEGAGSPRAHSVRRVMAANLSWESTEKVVITIAANGFLRYMVRNIVGTLVEVGRGKISPDQFAEILASRDRARAGATAPPQGLCLVAVTYSNSG